MIWSSRTLPARGVAQAEDKGMGMTAGHGLEEVAPMHGNPSQQAPSPPVLSS